MKKSIKSSVLLMSIFCLALLFGVETVGAAPPVLETEAYITDNSGIVIADGGIVNLENIDEAGEVIRIYSSASDDVAVIDHKIKYWHFDSEGVEVGFDTSFWLEGGLHYIEINGPLNDGDRIEYYAEATDCSVPPNTTYDPADYDQADRATRYSFTVSSSDAWIKTFEVPGFSGYAREIKQTFDGGYIVMGERYDGNDWDFQIIKLSSSGDIEWTRAYGGFALGDYDHGWSVLQTPAGEYVIAGDSRTFAPSNASEFVVMKLDSNGDEMWTRTFDTGNSKDNNARSVIDAGDGYLIGGTSGGRIALMKIDYSGNNILWQKKYGAGNVTQHFINKIDDGFIISFQSSFYSASSFDGVVMKIDPIGNVVWTKVFGGGNWDMIESVIETSDGKYLAVGYTRNFGSASNYNMFVLLLTSDGDIEWAKIFYDNDDGPFDDFTAEMAFSVTEIDGDYLIAGSIEGYSGVDYPNPFILKLNANGDQIWAKIILDVISSPTGVISIKKTSDHGFVVAGQGTEIFILKFDSSGNIPACNVVDPTFSIISDDVTMLALKSSPTVIPSVNTLNLDLSVNFASDSPSIVENDMCSGATPSVVPHVITDVNYCFSTPAGLNLNWDFSDPDPGDFQTAFEIKLTRIPDGLTCMIAKRPSSSTSILGSVINSESGCSDFIDYGGFTYDWQINVYDSNDNSSGFVNGSTFPSEPTPLYIYPESDFTATPNMPGKDSSVLFENSPGGFTYSHAWDFCGVNIDDNGDLLDGTSRYYYFSDEGPCVVKLIVTEQERDIQCSSERSFRVRSMPSRTEVVPTP